MWDEPVGVEGHGGQLSWFRMLVGAAGSRNSGELSALQVHIWRWVA